MYIYIIYLKIFKSTSSSYVQNMIENMGLTSYFDKSYFVARIQMMSFGKLKHQVKGQFYLVAQHNFHVASVVTLYYDCKTSKCCNRCIFSLTTCEVLRHTASFFLHSHAARSSIQKFDNDCNVIFMFKM